MRDNIKKLYQTPWLALALLAAADLLMIADLLPLYFSFFIGAFAVVYTALAPRVSALFFVIASFPFSPALPIPGFESFALWRLLVLTLAAREIIRGKILSQTVSFRDLLARLKASLILHEWLGLMLLVLGMVSIAVALNPVAGLRKLIFLSNAILLYVVLRWIFSKNSELKKTVTSGLRVALFGVLLVGVAQYISVVFVSLYDFWQGWALDTIPVFYGDTLGRVLSTSNTWFSYYENDLPTLRMFSVLPDSHSFGLMMLFGFTLATALTVPKIVQSPRFPSFWALNVLEIGAYAIAIFLSGSRGIWLSAVPTALAAVGIYWLGKKRQILPLALTARMVIASFALLFLLFPLASIISSNARGAGIDEAQREVLIKRAKSIFDFEEISNRTRLQIWKTVGESIIDKPILGVGFGNTAVALQEPVEASRKGASAHNLYLDVAVETGVVGGLLIIGFLFAILLNLVNAAMRREFAMEKLSLAIAFSLAVVWVGFYNLFDVVLLNDRALLAFLCLLAISVTNNRKVPKRIYS